MSDQDIPPENSEALDSPPMLEQGCLSDHDIPSEKSESLDSPSIMEHDQDIPSGKSEALDSLSMLEHTKVVCVIKISLLKIKLTGLTSYVVTCKDCLCDQDSLLRNQRHWNSPPMLEHAKVV